MIIRFTQEFRKQYKKADVRTKRSFDQHIAIFTKNPMDLQLRNHVLRDKWQGYRSINITADWRAFYREEVGVDEEIIVYFIALGTHSQLYR